MNVHASSMTAAVDRAALAAVTAREAAAFAARTPRSAALRDRALRAMPGGVPMTWMTGLYRSPPIYVTHGAGATFVDADGHAYLDFNLCDLSMTLGFGAEPIARAVSEAARTGAHFLLPTEAAVEVAEELAARVGLPFWQFTLSATGANAEVLRVARVATGRRRLLVFENHYHGHFDEGLVARGASGASEPDLLGLPPGAAADTLIVPFNDLPALERALAGGDVALVLAEPAMTNCTLVLPAPGYLEGLQEVVRRHGALLAYDEAHTFQFAYGGLTRAWGLASDFVVLGKGLGSGISFALYGMSEEVAQVFSRHSDADVGPRGIATGGTTFGSAVAAAAARAALAMLTPAAYDHLDALGGRLGHGLQALFDEVGLPWRAQRLGPRSGTTLAPDLPRDGAEAWRSVDAPLIDARRLYLANRGLWDAVISAGPQASLAHGPADIDRYLAAVGDFLREVAA